MREREAAEQFYLDGRPRQRRFDFRVYRSSEVRETLNELFYGKCAYCEVALLSVEDGDVELFRPKWSVAERPDHPGYWWLAADWNNLLISCRSCSRERVHAGERTGKADRFPLDDETRRGWGPGEELGEEPLLLDPCLDNPEDHLVFDEHGVVASYSARGQASISILSLNRPELVGNRLAAIELVKFRIEEADELARLSRGTENQALRSAIAHLEALVEPREAFAALKRQLVLPFLHRVEQQGLQVAPPEATATTPTITEAQKALAKASYRQFQVDQSSFSLTEQSGRDTYRFQRRLIQHVDIRNVKAIRELHLDLTDADAGRTPWLMLLGENGTGKSTALQAIALTLVGAKAIARLMEADLVRPQDFVRYRCKTGTVSVQVTGFVGPHRLTFHRDRVEFQSPTGDITTVTLRSQGSPVIEGRGWEPQMVLLGYGATRLPPQKRHAAAMATGDGYSRVDNLFDPFVPLYDAERWLTGLADEAGKRAQEGQDGKRQVQDARITFDNAALILKDLLSLDPESRVDVEDDRVVVYQHGAKVPLRTLSDGYQSVVATAIDVFEMVTRIWPNLQSAGGIVLLDELGAHLHPTWKMRIVGSVRQALPGVQFITSTHDPLCLRGLSAGEVVVMQRDESDRVRALTDLPSPGDFRIEQLLTSDFFGLDSTSDPDTDAIFDEYYTLLALSDPTPEQAQRIEHLKQELGTGATWARPCEKCSCTKPWIG